MLLHEAEWNAKLIVVLIYLYPFSSVDLITLINLVFNTESWKDDIEMQPYVLTP